MILAYVLAVVIGCLLLGWTARDLWEHREKQKPPYKFASSWDDWKPGTARVLEPDEVDLNFDAFKQLVTKIDEEGWAASSRAIKRQKDFNSMTRDLQRKKRQHTNGF